MKIKKSPEFWKRFVIGFIIISIAWFWYSGMMLHHIWDSPFNYKGADISYWVIYWSKIPMIVLFNETSATIFSLLLIGAFLLAFIFINSRSLVILAGSLLLLYQILFNLKLGYHTHHLYGLQFALLPFYFKRHLFHISFEFARILACLTYFFAGFFKLIGMAWVYRDSFVNTLQNQHAAYLYFQTESIRSHFIYWMLEHSMFAWLFFLIAMLFQLSFLSGLFTKRFDILLGWFILLFHTMDWFLMNLGVFMGMTILMYLFFAKNSIIAKNPIAST